MAWNNVYILAHSSVGQKSCTSWQDSLVSVLLGWSQDIGRALAQSGVLSSSLVIRRICFLAIGILKSPFPCWSSAGASLSLKGLPTSSCPHNMVASILKSGIACPVPCTIYSNISLYAVLLAGKILLLNGSRNYITFSLPENPG